MLLDSLDVMPFTHTLMYEEYPCAYSNRITQGANDLFWTVTSGPWYVVYQCKLHVS